MDAGMSAADARRILGLAQKPPLDASLMMAPQPTLYAAAEAGLRRGTRPAGVILASSALGGALLAFGGCMFVMVAGGTPELATAMPGLHKLLPAMVFPIGLSMVVFTGTDLLTSSFMYHSLPFLTHPHRNVNAKTSCKVWSLNFVGNFAGSATIAAAAAAYIFTTDPWTSWATSMAVAKTSMPFAEVCGRTTTGAADAQKFTRAPFSQHLPACSHCSTTVLSSLCRLSILAPAHASSPNPLYTVNPLNGHPMTPNTTGVC